MAKVAKQIKVDEKAWRSVRMRALELGLSIGDYLMGLHSPAMVSPGTEVKVPHSVISVQGDGVYQDGEKISKVSEDKVIADAQKRLEEVKERNGVKQSSWFGGSYSKDRQLGKK